jgi:hypothetical protein
MRSLNKSAALFLGCFIVTLLILAPAYLRGDEWNRATKFEVSQPFEVPGMALQPNTRYVIRLLDSPSTRNVVQIYNEDQTKMLTMFMGISSERSEAADHTVFSFIETEPGNPLPIKEWFYPGRTIGLEFVYPKDQALKIAGHAREPVLATDSVNLHDLSSITVEAIEPLRDRDSSVAQTATMTRTETTQSVEEPIVEPAREEAVVEQEQAVAIEQEQPAVQEQEEQKVEEEVQIAENQQPEPVQQPEPAPAVSDEDDSRELPRTAGELPLVALIGVLCVGAGLGLRVLSTRS